MFAVSQTQPDPAAASMRVGMRSSLTRQIRQEKQPFTARWCFGCRTGDQFVRVNLLLFGLQHFGLAQLIAKPLQTAARRKYATHHVPLAPHRMTEGVQTSLGVHLHLVTVSKHDATGSHGCRNHAASHDAIANRTGGLVTSTTHHRNPGSQSHLLRCRFRQNPRHILAFINLWQQAAAEIQLLQQFGGPAAVHDVQQQCSRGIADLRRKFTRQTESHIILGQQDLHCAVEIAFFLISQPQNLGRREAGQSRIGHHPNQLSTATGPTFYFSTLRHRSLIIPQQSRANDLVLFVQKDAAVHLTAEPDAANVCGLQLCGTQHLLHGIHNGLPPVRRTLL